MSTCARCYHSNYFHHHQPPINQNLPLFSLNLQVASAEGFTVDYYNSYKIVTNKIANETYVLYQCGTSPPAADAIPEGAKVFQIPLTSISAPETVPYTFLEILGLDDRVNDVSSFVTSACGQKILGCGREGPDAMALDNTTMLDETVGPSVDGLLTSAAYSYPKSFAFSAAQDPGVLNRVEWIKFLGTFFNLDKYASSVYDTIVEEYNQVKAAAAEAGEGEDTKPVVAWASHFLFDTEEAYQLSFAPYKEELTTDAGAALLDFEALLNIPGVRTSAFSNTTLEFAWDGAEAGSFATKEEAKAAFIEALSTVDAVIDETYTPDSTTYNLAAFLEEYDITESELESMPWFTNELIFRQDGLISETNGVDWFEGAFVRPDKTLSDVLRIVTAAREAPEDATPLSQEYTWLRQIEEAPRVVNSDECQRLDSCTEEPTPICPFVAVCGDGSSVLLTSGTSEDNAQCSYAACPLVDSQTNTAQMAAPAVIVLTVLIVFVEALINFC